MNLFEYIGKFHPLLVHLPIGILIIFLILRIYNSPETASGIIQNHWIILLISALSATFSCISGLILSRSGEYEAGVTANHRNLGIALALLNWIIFFTFKKLLNSRLWMYNSTLILISIVTILNRSFRRLNHPWF